MIDNSEQNKQGRVVVLGDVLLDKYILGDVERISPEAPVPVLREQGSYCVGGGAANVAANIASLGCQAQLVGVVGKDKHGDLLRKFLEQTCHVAPHLLVSEDGWPTICKTRIVSGDQQIVRVDDEHLIDFTQHTKKRLFEHAKAALEHADIFVISDYGKGVVTKDLFQELVSIAKEKSIPVIVDPKKKDFSFYRGASLLTPNRRELLEATGGKDTSEAEIIEAGNKAVKIADCDILVTRSEDGMTLIKKDGHVLHERAQKAEIYDVSGAGDTVVATLAASLSVGTDIQEAIRRATVAASIVVARPGTSVVSGTEFKKALQDDPLHAALIVNAKEGRDIVTQWHRHGEKIVFTNGCFDLIHPGHIQLLREAARLGDKLIVALNSDASIKRLKGPQRPVQNQEDRMAIMAAIRGVDMVVLFDEDTPYHLIENLRPDILVKGADYHKDDVVGGDIVNDNGGEVVLVPILPGRSTTSLIGIKKES